jgi:hypothetical protein
MRRALGILAGAAAVAAVAPAPALAVAARAPAPSAAPAAATVQTMVVGRTRVLRGTRTVRLRARGVKVGGRRCAVGAATPLGVLAGLGLRLQMRDYGSCGRSPRDAGGLYVVRIGADGERGTGGWVYKVGRRIGTGAAADPAGPFGTGRRLRSGDEVLWFWCRAAGACQRTLEVEPQRNAMDAGSSMTVKVVGYDDQGRGVPVVGATVRLGSGTFTAGAGGVATVTAPGRGEQRAKLVATMDGMVRSFTDHVIVR